MSAIIIVVVCYVVLSLDIILCVSYVVLWVAFVGVDVT